MTTSTKEQLREEFGNYLRDNWDDRENLPVADWWLYKLDSLLEQKVKAILKLKKGKEFYKVYAAVIK